MHHLIHFYILDFKERNDLNMNKRKKACVLCTALLGCIIASGCTSDKKFSDVEKVVYTTLSSEEVVSIAETPSEKKIKGEALMDVKIVLNLDSTSKSIAYEKSLETVTLLLANMDVALENKINDYTFLINSSKLDVYGNSQKVKVAEIKIDKNTVDKINFDNFNYLNLDKIAQVKKFKYLTEK